MKLTKIEFILKKFEGQRIIFKPNPGNGGDALIASAAFHLFENFNIKYSIYEEGMDLMDDIVFYGGGGNLVQQYNQAAVFIKNCHKVVKHLLILPHTINSHEKLLMDLGSNVTICCRERISFEYVQKTALNASTFLVEDLAFSLKPYLYKNNKHNLSHKLLLSNTAKKILYSQSFRFSRLYAFREDIERTSKTLRKENRDVSEAILFNKQMNNRKSVDANTAEIFYFLSLYRKIYTNRLHIAIAGALLNKKVIFSSNSYYKNEAIYNLSLQEYKSVEFHSEN